MTRFDRIDHWVRERDAHPPDVALGFVPTMGALHEGHRSLIRRSTSENARTLVSIFVNPTQFDDPDDLAAYPRTWEEDVAMLEAEGVDYVLMPRPEQLYPDGYRYRVTETQDARMLEGAYRPQHFDGVLTVVLKLLLIARARRAYFGEKDWQQLQLVQGMARALFLRTEIVPCATVRESSGLAISSRNTRLTPEQRQRAARVYVALSASGSASEAEARLRSDGFDVDYVVDREGRRLAAVRVGDVRLIDNVPLGSRA